MASEYNRSLVISIISQMMDQREYSEMTECESGDTSKADCFTCIKDDDIAMIYYAKVPKINIELYREIEHLIEANTCSLCIIISDLGATPDTKKQKSLCRTQFFLTKQLTYNPTKHEYVPKHTKLSDDDIKREIPNIKSENIPKINNDEVIVRFMGYNIGDIIRIDRKKEPPSYRIVS